MELKLYWAVIRRWIWMIVMVTVIATITSGVVSKYVIKPMYQATTTILVNQKYTAQDALSGMIYNDVMTNEALVGTYSEVMKSNAILSRVIHSLNLPYTTAQLAAQVTVTSNNQSEVISLSVNDRSIAKAVLIANLLARDFQHKVVQLMQVKNVQVLDPASVPAQVKPISPKTTTNVAIAFVLGLMVSVGIAFLIEYLDDSVRTDEEVTQILGVPLLGTISTMEGERKKLSLSPVPAVNTSTGS